MNIEKELPAISWQVGEPEYRADPALSYSTLSKYEREGFSNIDHLSDRVSTPQLTEGSMVDTLITGSQEEFDRLFYVTDLEPLGEKEKIICDKLFDIYGNQYHSMSEIPFASIVDIANEVNFRKNWRDLTRRDVLVENCSEHYNLKHYTEGRTVVDIDTFHKVQAMVKALRESPNTKGYFADNDPDLPIRRYYQLKFKGTVDGVDYRCMADLLIADYQEHIIIPCDLKTSGHGEYEFKDSFIKWNYYLQAILYWKLIRQNLDKDNYFKDFKLEDYRFIVVNKNSLTPLVWKFPYTQVEEILTDKYGTEFRSPFEIGKELRRYLTDKPKVPDGINLYGENIIDCLRPAEKWNND